MGFLFTSKKEKIVAIFDIGSGSVGGAIVRIPFDENKIPSIIKSVRSDIKSRQDSNSDLLVKDMLTAISQTANSLYEKKIGAPEEIFCVLASPWYISETRTIKTARESSFIFTKRLANDLIQKEIINLNNLYKDKYNGSNSQSEVIEQNTMAVSLNGYMIDDPLGKRCKSFEMDMFISLAPKKYLDLIRETISKTYHHKEIRFSSFSLATYFAVRDKYMNQDSYLIIDVSGEITDVGIVTKGVLRSVLSFPFGKRTFFKNVCTKLDIEQRDAEELFKLYNSGNLSLEFKKKVTPVFKEIENAWGEAFRNCVIILPRTLLLPSTIFLTADDDVKNWFADILRSEEYVESTLSGHKCQVVTLDGSLFLNMCDIKNGSCDEFLMIEAIAITRKMGK